MDRQTSTPGLTDDERELLGEILESAYRALKQEIGRTEGAAFKTELQARRETLRALIEKLVGGQPLQDEV